MKISLTMISILVVYILFGQCCMRFRWRDNKASKVFGARQVPLQIFDTIVQGQNIHYVISGADSLPTMVFIHGSLEKFERSKKYTVECVLKFAVHQTFFTEFKKYFNKLINNQVTI